MTQNSSSPLKVFVKKKGLSFCEEKYQMFGTRIINPRNRIQKEQILKWTSSQRFEFSLLGNNSKREWNHPPEEFTAFMLFFP